MNEKITAFLDEVCSHIKYKKIHGDIRAELTEHILENAENSSVEEAILQMGSGAEIGERLNKEHKPQTEWSIIALGATIALIGGFIMYASSKFEGWHAVDFGRYITCVIIGLSVLVGLYFFDYTKLKKLSLPLYCIAIILTIIIDIYRVYSFQMFLRIGSVTVSLEYAIILFAVSFSGFIEKYRGQGGFAIVKLLILGGLSFVPIISLRNRSIIYIMMICYVVLTFTAVMRNHFGGNKKIQLVSLGVLGIVGVGALGLYISQHQYLIQRMESFLSRGESDPLGSGWQQKMSDWVLSSSSWFGETGMGKGWELYLPAAANENILVNVIATFGWAVGIALIMIVALFITHMFMTVRKVKADYGFYLSLSACVILSAQFVINILMNFGLFPIIGVNMPFVSYGGTGYIISMALLGIILSVWRRNNLLIGNIKTPINKLGRFIEFHDGKLTINFNKRTICIHSTSRRN